MVSSARSVLLRDALAATLGIFGLYGLSVGVQLRPFVIPGYILVVGFDALEATLGSAGGNYNVLFAAYLVVLGLLGAGLAHLVRTHVRGAATSGWRLGLAGGLAVVAILSLALAVVVLFGTSQIEPVLITGATGVVLLVLAVALSGLIEARRPASAH